MLEVPDKIRLKLAKKYLDWAETLPQFQGGTIAWLQEIRKHQRERSEYSRNEYKIPENTSVEYSFFSLAELFFIEDVKQLKNNLLKLFPDLDSSTKDKKFSNEISDLATSVSRCAYIPLGHIVKERKSNHYFFGRELVEIESLPEEVSNIDVSLYKLFPSCFLVKFDVFLNEKASNELIELQKLPNLPDIRFEALIPIKMSGYSEHSSYTATAKKVSLWKEKLRGKVEKSLKPYLNVYFTKNSSNKIAKLPSFEVFQMKGIENNTDNLSKWIENNREWLNYSGCNIDYFNAYTNYRNIFSFYRKVNSIFDAYSSNQLVVLLNNYKDKDEKPNVFDSIKDIAIRESHSLCIALVPYCTLLELIDSLQEKIEKLRETVFTNVNSNLISNFSLGSQIKLNNIILQNSILVDRINSEVNNNNFWFLDNYANLEEFRCIDSISEKETSNNSDLRHNLIELTKERSEFLKNHIKMINDWYSQYLSLRNMSTIYWFTFAILLLTIVSVIGTSNVRDLIVNFINNLNTNIL